MAAKHRENLARFRESYQKLAGVVHVANSPQDVAEVAARVLKQEKATKLVFADFPRRLSDAAARLRTHADFSALELDGGGVSLARRIAVADAGIGPAEFAIAFTGTIVEVSGDDASRLVSSLPRVHVALLPCSRILRDLEEAGPRLREIYSKHESNCNITFISGPSRTADIEMRLFLGVHGPQASHVIVCDWC